MSKQLADWQELYREKNKHLDQFLEPVQPHEFYRENSQRVLLKERAAMRTRKAMQSPLHYRRAAGSTA